MSGRFRETKVFIVAALNGLCAWRIRRTGRNGWIGSWANRLFFLVADRWVLEEMILQEDGLAIRRRRYPHICDGSECSDTESGEVTMWASLEDAS
jgi:hypothetical protein